MKSSLYAMIVKEFKHVLRDGRSLFFLLAQPVMMMTLFGFALSNEVKESRVVIINQAHDEMSAALIDRFDESRYFHVVGTIDDSKEVSTWFEQGKALLAIVFPAHFAEDLKHTNKGSVQILADASDPNTAAIAANYAGAILRNFQSEGLGLTKLPYEIKVEPHMLYNPQLISAFNFVPGVMTLILMILGAMMTSVAIVREKETGTMEVLLASPMHPMQIVISKAVPYMVLAFVNVLIILFLSVFVLNVPIRGSLFLLLAESVLFISTTLALGLLISTSTEKQQVAMFISLVGLMLPALIFSGFMFPIENMPLPLRVISHVVPTRWYYSIVRAIMIKGLGIASIWKETLILGGMTIVLIAIAVKKFKVHLQ
ncbi:MAG: ABC transporter permease [Saprospiraceae bacterium]|jgi:ABC-2 type transport system permease protein|nr:ABC transporter permease [Saprospiraceae bacterium]MBK6813985.1 ABC transporter permease [Saprospiraceae bacterium]MBK7373417.1 ABC transporter permease [Saprospiraceae bacterium]MBK8512873.1 ABC transporter permease [Saprospiraceae bacterium]MBK9678224.1 ABC transporter permease [Saprospiraceae bacterium]